MADANVAAQQEGISALCAFLKFGGTQACTRLVGMSDICLFVLDSY